MKEETLEIMRETIQLPHKQFLINKEHVLEVLKLVDDYDKLKQSAELSISQLNGEKVGLEIERDRLKDAYNHAIFHLYNSSNKQIGFDEFKEKEEGG